MNVFQKIGDVLRYQAGRISMQDVTREGDICLLYHGVTVADCGHLNKRQTTVSVFDQQLDRFGRYYSFVPVEDFFADRGKQRKKPLMAITFDDGYWNNLHVALPVLKMHNAPATIYVTGLNNTPYPMIWADLLDLTERYWNKGVLHVDGHEFVNINDRFVDRQNGQSLRDVIRFQRPEWAFKESLYAAIGYDPEQFGKRAPRESWALLSDTEIAALAAEPLVTIGSHGFYHNNLASVSATTIEKELEDSIRYIERVTGRTTKHIAFPDGSYNDEVKRVCSNLGLSYMMADEQFRCLDEHENPNLIVRKGLYNCGRPHSQLYDIYRQP